MKLLANENFPLDAVEALRQSGHDIVWIRTESPGIDDQQVLAIAQVEQRLLLTFDKDFGELAFRAQLPAKSGIILFRISTPSSVEVAEVVTNILNSRTDWSGHFSVITDRRIRMRPLPRQWS
jgi:predicted nuclease of predicted toxin-antitoxin system